MIRSPSDNWRRALTSNKKNRKKIWKGNRSNIKEESEAKKPIDAGVSDFKMEEQKKEIQRKYKENKLLRKVYYQSGSKSPKTQL